MSSCSAKAFTRLLTNTVDSTDQMLALVEDELLEGRQFKVGDGVVLSSVNLLGQSGSTNLLKLPDWVSVEAELSNAASLSRSMQASTRSCSKGPTRCSRVGL